MFVSDCRNYLREYGSGGHRTQRREKKLIYYIRGRKVAILNFETNTDFSVFLPTSFTFRRDSNKLYNSSRSLCRNCSTVFTSRRFTFLRQRRKYIFSSLRIFEIGKRRGQFSLGRNFRNFRESHI